MDLINSHTISSACICPKTMISVSNLFCIALAFDFSGFVGDKSLFCSFIVLKKHKINTSTINKYYLVILISNTTSANALTVF